MVLPQSAEILAKKGFTGYQGSREGAVVIATNTHGNITFETSRILKPREGLTIAVGWPKGYVREPSRALRFAYFMYDNAAIILSFLGVLVLLGYYLIVWYRVGRDPAKGTIIPLFHPPQDFSPALVRYIKRMGHDERGFTAAILNMRKSEV